MEFKRVGFPQIRHSGRILNGLWHMAVIAAVVSLLSGCAMVGPDYVKPTVQEPKEWLTQESKIKTENIDYAQWWTVFNDPALNRLVETAYNQNLTLQVAGLRVLQARARR